MDQFFPLISSTITSLKDTISINLIIILAISGIFSGFSAGLLGVGGGLVLVPVIFFILASQGLSTELSMLMALATSMNIIILTSISSAYAHIKSKKVDKKIIKTFLISQFFGALVGAYLADYIGGDNLLRFFGFFVLYSSIMFIKKSLNSQQKAPSKLSFKLRKYIFNNKFIEQPIAFTIGFLCAILGIGGGILNVPFFSLKDRSMHSSVATSACFGFVIAVPATIGYIYSGLNSPDLSNHLANINIGPNLGYVNILIFIIVFPISVLTAPIGARIAHRLSIRNLRLVFGIFLLLVAINMIF